MTQRIEINSPLLRSLLVLATVLEANDPYSGGHVWRTSRYSRALALAAGMEEGDVFLAQLGGLLHDVGKVGIPDTVLLKPGKFTEEEHRVIQRHTEIGHDIIANHPLAPLVDRPIAEHHLRVDGAGYPSRLGETSPWIISRIVSIADAFDAMTSFHPTRRDDAVDSALLALEEGRGRQFDADLAETFTDMVRLGALDHVVGHAGDGFLQLDCAECGPFLAPPTAALDGRDIECPAFGDAFVLRFAPSTFDLGWTARSIYSC